jgi:putative ABC transport system permease protein
MFKNYLKTAWRNLRRNKIFSFINIIGLSIGISASLVIYLLVSYDLSFDKDHKSGDRIYRVVTDFVFAGQPVPAPGVSAPMPDAIRRELTGLDLVVPLYVWEDENVSIPEPRKELPTVYRKQNHIVFADDSYFKMISYDWVAGSPATSLQQPYQVVLTESAAKYYFPALTAGEIIGRRVNFNDTVATTVTGLVKDLAYNTDFTFRVFLSRSTLTDTRFKPQGWDQWGSTSSSSQLFLKLARGTTAKQMEDRIAGLEKKYNKHDPNDPSTSSHRLQPLKDLHFNNAYGNFFSSDHLAHKPTLYSLLAVAAFLLLLACINFINLSTAQSSERAKEVGIRKTIGGSRRQLLFQFLGETFLLTLFAALLSLLLIPFLLKVFSDFIPEGLHFSLTAQPFLLLFLGMLVLLVSILSGLYPAVVLSSYRPVLVLKNQLHAQTGRSRRDWLRRTLTVSQFFIAQVFIIATLLVSKQINYSLNKDMGFKKDAIVYATTSFYDRHSSHRYVLVNKLKALPGVSMVSLSSSPPSIGDIRMSTLKYVDGKKEIQTDVHIKFADTNYIGLYRLKLLSGHTPLNNDDTVHGIVINETYMRTLGFSDPGQVIGKQIEWDGRKVPVIGVVADFHQKSLHDPIAPLVIAARTSEEITVNLALIPQGQGGVSWKATLAGMAKAWSEVYPETDFEYEFQDETIAKYYKTEQDISRLLTWATGLVIFISCLGLLGLVIYTTNQRRKEIGIRKIVGASVMQLIALLSADFLTLIGLAFLIAVPVAWWGTHKWLENFAYRTELSWWLFLAGGGIMLVIAFIILSIRTFHAAVANPVKSLRAE